MTLSGAGIKCTECGRGMAEKYRLCRCDHCHQIFCEKHYIISLDEANQYCFICNRKRIIKNAIQSYEWSKRQFLKTCQKYDYDPMGVI